MTSTPKRIIDLEPGDALDGTYLLRDRELRRTPNGAVYMACLVADRSGTVDGRWWKASETAIRALAPGCFVQIEGKAQSHRGKVQLVIDRLERVSSTPELLDALLPKTEQNVEDMWAEMSSHVGAVKNRHLRRLLQRFLDDAEIAERYKRVPAGAKLHHAVVGGLLEHSLQMMRMARATAGLYGELLHEDLLIAGVFLHDVAKTAELTGDGSFAYTDRGNLVGHIVLGASWIERRAEEVAAETDEPFPPVLVDLLQHLVISHHGSRDRGSPKPPMTPEALVLHALDDLDTRLAMARETFEADRDPTASFTHFHRVLDVKLFKRPSPLPGDDLDG